MTPATLLAILKFLEDVLPELEAAFTAGQLDLGILTKATSVAPILKTATAAVTAAAAAAQTPNGANGS